MVVGMFKHVYMLRQIFKLKLSNFDDNLTVEIQKNNKFHKKQKAFDVEYVNISIFPLFSRYPASKCWFTW